MPPSNSLSYLYQYGLDTILTPQDDPILWATVLARHWPLPLPAILKLTNVRFGIGQIAMHTAFKIQPLAAWCFERADPEHIRPIVCSDASYTDADYDPTLLATVSTPLFYSTFLGIDWPYLSLVITRPSLDVNRVLVFFGHQSGPRMGLGQTHCWIRDPDGGWQETPEVLAQWVS